ncbi:hypothetical protein GE061_011977 [Apolygus lucorum]|uniref:Uncharacterized protein n=1 Tax=Apolygus lucorum TaxID=248454 RepID=A0A8S9XV29_APOLU|nr:hypothetical protein GE061_011977 [Apolygus lucorum]
MAVKQVRFMEDKKKNSKFQFFMVADYDSADVIDVPPKNNKQPGKINNVQQQKPSINKENNGHSKPYNEDFVPKKHSGFGHHHSTTAHKSSTVPKSTTAVPASTIRPGRYHLNSSTTFSPLPSYKINASSINLVKNDPPSREGCLNCEESNQHKQHKYPVYPSKKDQPEGLQAVKLLGPDGDSILGDSKHHYTVAMPGTPQKQFNSTKPRVPKSGLNYRQHHSSLDQRERRKPFQGLDNAGSYSSHVGGSVEYVQRPKSGFYPENRFRTKGTKKPDMSDLYNLDELESSGSSISSSHVKYETKEIHIPYAVTVEKKVSYPIHIKVDRPVPVHIDKPYPVHVEKKVPVPVKVHVPQPYPIEKEVPYPVKIPIEVPRPVEVPKPVPYIVEKPVPVQIIKEVKFPVKVPVDVPVPYKVPLQVEKRIPYFIEKKVPFEVPVAVEKPYFVEIKKPFEVPVEKPHPVTVEKKIPVPMQVIEFVKVPIPVRVPIEGYSDYVMHRSGDSGSVPENDGNVGVVPAAKLEDTNLTTGKNQTEEPKMQKRMGVIDQPGGRPAFPHNIPNMISIEFSHPDLNQDPKVTLYTDGSEQLAERN